MLVALLDEHLSDRAGFAGNSIFPLLLRRLSHIIDRDHIPVADTHIHGEVQYLCEEPEVVRDSIVENELPVGHVLILLTCVVTDSIAPKVTYIADLIL